MIVYLTIFLLLLFCIIEYDIKGTRQHREFFVRLFLFIFICVAGFSYRLGGDGINYLNEWENYGTFADISSSYLTGFKGRMPGWVLLSTLCKTVTNDFCFFHCVHAIIVNMAYVRVIKSNTGYVFVGLLLYFSLIYFNQNFQILRESLAISFFLLSLPYFYKGKWIMYFSLILLAISFHEGAAFLLFIPLLKVFRINKWSVVIYAVIGLLIIRYASVILSLLLSVQVDGEIQGKIFAYQKDMDSDYEFTSLCNLFLNVIFPLFVLYYYSRQNVKVEYIHIIIFACLIYILSLVVPIIYRLSNYMLIFNYLLVSSFILDYVKTKTMSLSHRIATVLLIIMTFVSFKGRMYFLPYGESGIPSYVQYYPYSSIFDKEIYMERERLYRTN